MQILERSVTKPFWQKIQRLIVRDIRRGKSVTNASGILRIDHHEQRMTYAILKDGVPVSWLHLWRDIDWAAWEVLQIFTTEECRGQGLAKLLYNEAINRDKVILASGITQSKSSRLLWASFIKNEMFEIFAIDYLDMSRRSQVFIDEDLIWCSLDIYSESQSEDIRLIAIRKRK